MPCSRRTIVSALALGVCAAATRANAEGSSGPVEVDVSDLAVGKLKIATWKDQPVWLLRRSPEMLQQLQAPSLRDRLADPDSTLGLPASTPEYARNTHRSIKPEVFVGLASCPHEGCRPIPRLKPGPNPERADNWPGGFACQCHFARFDLAGRVFKGSPARENIQVPRHSYRGETSIVIGRDHDGEA